MQKEITPLVVGMLIAALSLGYQCGMYTSQIAIEARNAYAELALKHAEEAVKHAEEAQARTTQCTDLLKNGTQALDSRVEDLQRQVGRAQTAVDHYDPCNLQCGR